MYIGTDLISKNGLSEKMDKLDFTFSISSKSIPFSSRYGIDLVASSDTVYDIAPVVIRSVLNNLADPSISLKGLSLDGRDIGIELDYKDTRISTNTQVQYR